MAYAPVHFQQYPGMERQDLTQGQLGSFKFTPVDNAPHQRQPHGPSPTHDWFKTNARRQLEQQFQESLQNVVGVKIREQQPLYQHDAPAKVVLPHYSSKGRYPLSSETSATSFNQDIRPDLDQSRLKLGTAAIRSAVQCQSPERKSFRVPIKDPFTTAARPDSHYQRHSGSGSGSSSGSSDMNPIAASFIPSITSSQNSVGLEDISVSTQTMFSALAAEQEAHRRTQATLDETSIKLHASEAETKKLSKQVKSLVSAVNMLGGIIKHNQSRLGRVDVPSSPKGNKPVENVSPTKSDTAMATATMDLKPVKSHADDTNLFNFDLLGTPKSKSYSKVPINQNDSQLIKMTPKSSQVLKNVESPTNVSAVNLAAPDTPSHLNPTQTVFTSDPLKLNIKWKVTADNPIYEDEQEKLSSVGLSRVNYKPDSPFWNHPVRCLDVLDKNLFRTVMIDGIPIGCTSQHVLEHIYGGAIERIDLIGPIGRTNQSMTARLVFHYELAASSVAANARDRPMIIRGKQVRVWQVLTQTYPKNRQLERDVFENMYTRLLLINLKNATVTDEVKNQWRAMLPEKLSWLHSSIVEISKSVDGFDLVEFTSVVAATAAMEQLRSDRDFGSIEMDFEDDPCAEPYPFGV